MEITQMDIAQLVVQIFAALGSLASGAMLIYSIVIFKKNLVKSEATKIRDGLFVIERNLLEVGNSISIEKTQIYELLTKEPLKHALLSIYNKIQVSYKSEIMKKVISDKLKEILPIKHFLLFERENDYKKLSEMKREFSVSLRKMNALKYLIYLYCNDYQTIVKSLQTFFDENSLIENIVSIFSENDNRLVTFESFIDALCLKCYNSLKDAQLNKSKLLELSFNMSTVLINSLLDIPNDKQLVENANISQQFFSEATLEKSTIKNLFSIYDKYYRKTISINGDEINNKFTHNWGTYIDLKDKQVSN